MKEREEEDKLNACSFVPEITELAHSLSEKVEMLIPVHEKLFVSATVNAAYSYDGHAMYYLAVE